jgi:hypothetical protein
MHWNICDMVPRCHQRGLPHSRWLAASMLLLLAGVVDTNTRVPLFCCCVNLCAHAHHLARTVAKLLPTLKRRQRRQRCQRDDRQSWGT